MRNRCKTLLRDHSVLEVTLKACLKHAQSQLYLRPSPLEDLKDLPYCSKDYLTMAEQVYVYSLDLIETYHFLHMSLPRGFLNCYLFTSLLEYLIKAVQNLCVCILPSMSVSVEILSCRAVKVLEFHVDLEPMTYLYPAAPGPVALWCSPVEVRLISNSNSVFHYL